jgi:hypothetical protein
MMYVFVFSQVTGQKAYKNINSTFRSEIPQAFGGFYATLKSPVDSIHRQLNCVLNATQFLAACSKVKAKIYDSKNVLFSPLLSSSSNKNAFSFILLSIIYFHSFPFFSVLFHFSIFPMSAVNKLFFSFLENWLPQLTQNGGTEGRGKMGVKKQHQPTAKHGAASNCHGE